LLVDMITKPPTILYSTGGAHYYFSSAGVLLRECRSFLRKVAISCVYLLGSGSGCVAVRLLSNYTIHDRTKEEGDVGGDGPLVRESASSR